tara:strand:+ start:3627 stop:4658 length:1032 start_codon:yes stop_codon:yes gene_type:complete
MSHKKELEDFLTDKEFRTWVLNPTPKSSLFWEKWLEANPQYEKEVLKARELVLSLKYPATSQPDEQEKDEILKSILQVSRTPQKATKPHRSYRFMRVAASVVLAIGIGLLFYYKGFNNATQVSGNQLEIQTIKKQNPKGRKSEIILSDGTRVMLNSNSTITYHSDFSQNRHIELDGEAYFEVAKDAEHPFRVKSGKVQTVALGTAFNVKAFEGTVDVFLTEGSVEVSVLDQSERIIRLEPMQKTAWSLQKGLEEPSYQKDMTDMLWTKGIIYFKETPISEVLRTLENWYDVQIDVSGGYEEVRYSGEFDNEYLSNVLQSMSQALDMTFDLTGKNVKIKFNKSL